MRRRRSRCGRRRSILRRWREPGRSWRVLLHTTSHVLVDPLGQDAAVLAVFKRAQLACGDEHLSLVEPEAGPGVGGVGVVRGAEPRGGDGGGGEPNSLSLFSHFSSSWL